MEDNTQNLYDFFKEIPEPTIKSLDPAIDTSKLEPTLSVYAIKFEDGKGISFHAKNIKEAYCLGVAIGLQDNISNAEIESVTDSNGVKYYDFKLNATKKEIVIQKEII